MRDSFGRDINYLRISVTDLCNLRCRYCMPETGITKVEHEDILSFEEFYTIAKVASELGVRKVRITGGEPLVKKDLVKFIKSLSSIEGIEEIALTTNGILLEKYAKSLKEAGLDRVNISLDTLNEEKYNSITRKGTLADVKKGIEEAKRVGLLPIKINVVLIGGFNIDEIPDFVALTKEDDIDIRFIELMPIGEALKMKDTHSVGADVVLKSVPELYPVDREDVSSPAKYYKLPDGKGKVGLIEPISCKFCGDCNRIRLTSKGKLKLCLHSEREIDLKPYLKDEDKLKEVLLESIGAKPKEHLLEEGEYVTKSMSKIGG